MEEKLVSVIVPIYNVEPYLNQCVKSIVTQTYDNLEIILVDDGSPDHCPEICDEWAKKDQRIRVLHKKNGGLSDARNAGLALCHGELVMFVDSDDWIAPEMAEKMTAAMAQYDADMVICQFMLALPDGRMQRKFDGEDAVKVYGRQEMFRLLLEDKEISNHVWRRLFKRSLLPENPFPVGKNYEDLYVMAELSNVCRTFVSLNDALYFYRDNANGILKTKTYKNVSDYLDALEKSYADIDRLSGRQYPERTEAKVRTSSYVWEDTMFSAKMTPEEKQAVLKRLESWADVPIKETKGVYWRRRVYYILIYLRKNKLAVMWYRFWIDPHSIWCHMRRGLKKAVLTIMGKTYEEPVE